MVSRNIQADILEYISDNKFHTSNEIAEAVEVSQKTVKRHIQALSYRFNIETFVGGINRGGIRLVSDKTIKIGYLRDDELQIIINSLEQLQGSNVNINKFINNLASQIQNKEQSQNEIRERCC